MEGEKVRLYRGGKELCMVFIPPSLPPSLLLDEKRQVGNGGGREGGGKGAGRDGGCMYLIFKKGRRQCTLSEGYCRK